jgi:hypothetical protein
MTVVGLFCIKLVQTIRGSPTLCSESTCPSCSHAKSKATEFQKLTRTCSPSKSNVLRARSGQSQLGKFNARTSFKTLAMLGIRSWQVLHGRGRPTSTSKQRPWFTKFKHLRWAFNFFLQHNMIAVSPEDEPSSTGPRCLQSRPKSKATRRLPSAFFKALSSLVYQKM